MLLVSHVRDRATLRAAAVITAGLLGGAALTGCGAGDDSAADAGETTGASDGATDSAAPSETASTDASADPSASADAGFDLPTCTSVWTVGQTFPAGYEGCLDADGAPVDAGGQYCEFGKPIFTFADNFYAVENGPVIQTEQPLGKDTRYQKALRSCSG